MIETQLPSLTLNDWIATRDTLHLYSQMVGKLRELMSPPNPHWWHISLRVSERGLTTTPMSKDKNSPGQTFEVILDLINHHLIIESNFREIKRIKLTGQSLSALCVETCSLLNDLGVAAPIEKELFKDGKSRVYDKQAATEYWQSIKEIDRVLNVFRSELNSETSPVQLWPHHFDMSMSWFSGRLVPGKDPKDLDSSKEQMSFGFSTGDETIPGAYFYVLSYPVPDGLSKIELPVDARWNTEGFQGGVMMYEAYYNAENPEEKLLNFFRTFQRAGSELMK